MLKKITKLLVGFSTVSTIAMGANQVTFQGGPLTLEGKMVKVGQKAPEFTLTRNDLSSIKLSDLKGKNVLISSVISVDTPVCDIQTKKFNEEAAKLKDVVVLTVSTDLPFALDRYCATNNIENTITASDYKTREFSKNYGLYIKELGLSSRAIFVIDKNGKITYTEYLKEITNEPNYENALVALKKITK